MHTHVSETSIETDDAYISYPLFKGPDPCSSDFATLNETKSLLEKPA